MASFGRLGLSLLLAFLLMGPASAFAQPQSDPTGDLLDKFGRPSSGEAFLDIVESELALVGDSFLGTIRLLGDVPSKTESSTFIEWDFMIDADMSNKTRPWSGEDLYSMQLLVNGIGVDYLVRLCLLGNDRYAQFYNGPKHKWEAGGPYEVNGNEITLGWLPSLIGGKTEFNFMVLVRRYGEGGISSALRVFDKAPNVGYYTLRAGEVTVVPEFPTASVFLITASALLIAFFGVRRRRCLGVLGRETVQIRPRT
jgi:hypothetical protein